MAEKAKIIPQSVTVRTRKKKRMLQYKTEDDAPTDPEMLFRINVFYSTMDTTINSIETRFTQLSTPGHSSMT
jgi:hypothetical protein